MHVSRKPFKEEKTILQQMNTESDFDVLTMSHKLFALLQENPQLLQNEANRKSVTELSEKIFIRKGNLNPLLKMAVTKLFYALHGLRATRVSSFDKEQSVKLLAQQHHEAQSLLVDQQTYPIRLRFLEDEQLSCENYFKNLNIELNDGERVTLCDGFLARFSKMLQAKNAQTAMRQDDTLILKQLDRDQCDVLIAFLETENKNLLYEDNLFALMETALYLQIPILLDACKEYLQTHVDMIDCKAFPELLNGLENATDGPLIAVIENKISQLFSRELTKEPLNSEFIELLDIYREQLQKPLNLTFCELSLIDHQLAMLQDIPLKSLTLTSCQQLTNEAIRIIASWSSLKELTLADNLWLDDHAFSFMPKELSSLALIALPNLTIDGFRDFDRSKLQHLTIQGCPKLSDEDLSIILPEELVSLDLRMFRNLGEKSIKSIAAMVHLRHLVLAGVTLTAEWVDKLPKDLETLDLAGCVVDDAVCEALAKMTRLQRLNLNRAIITDEGLARLPASLQWLSLCDCKMIGNQGVADLSKRKQLHEVELSGMPQISPKVVARLTQASITAHWQGPSAGNPSTWFK